MKNAFLVAVVAAAVLVGPSIVESVQSQTSVVTAAAVGGTEASIIETWPEGETVLVVNNSGGVISYRMIRRASRNGSPGPGPAPPQDGTSVEKIKEATKSVGEYPLRQKHLQALVIVYQAAAESVSAGRMGEAEARKRVADLQVQMWAEDAGQWSNWATAAASVSLSSVAEGLEQVGGALPAAASPQVEAARGEFFKRILDLFTGGGDGSLGKIIKLIMTLLELFGGI